LLKNNYLWQLITKAKLVKNFIFILASLFVISSCTVSEAPEFLELTNFKAKIVNVNKIQVHADAKFFNPNDVGCELIGTDISVFANGVDVGKVNQTKIIAIDNNSDFILPTSISFSPKEVFKKNGGLLNGALSALTSKEVDIQYLGSITLRKAGIPFQISIDETQKVPLKK
jgi:LEA14-like dessication related protein